MQWSERFSLLPASAGRLRRNPKILRPLRCPSLWKINEYSFANLSTRLDCTICSRARPRRLTVRRCFITFRWIERMLFEQYSPVQFWQISDFPMRANVDENYDSCKSGYNSESSVQMLQLVEKNSNALLLFSNYHRMSTSTIYTEIHQDGIWINFVTSWKSLIR